MIVRYPCPAAATPVAAHPSTAAWPAAVPIDTSRAWFSTLARLLLVLLMWGGLAEKAGAQVMSFTTAYNSAAAGSNCYTITPNAGNALGSVFSNSTINLAYDFDLNFTVTVGGADGIAFVLQPGAVGAGTGQAGGALNYYSGSGIVPSVAVELDTYDNGTGFGDSDGSHLALVRNSTLTPIQYAAITPSLNGGSTRPFRVTWTAATTTLRVYLDGAVKLTYVNNLVGNAFGGNKNVRFGFTGGCGGAAALQSMCVGTLTYGTEPIITSISPNPGVRGEAVTVTGTGLSNSTSVSVNGVAVAATSFVSNTATSLTFRVPATAGASGTTSLTNIGGTASVTSFTTVAATPPGNALTFDGTNDYVRIPDNNALDFGAGNFTVEAWVLKKSNSAGYVNSSIPGGKWSNGGNAGTNEWLLQTTANGNDNLPSFWVESGTTVYQCAGTVPVALNRWTHLAGVRQGGSLLLYMNGELQATVPMPAAAAVNNITGRDLLLGAIANGGTTNFFSNGSLDELRIYNTALTAANIQADMLSTASAVPASLVAYFNFDQGAAGGTNTGQTTLYDQTAGAYAGTLLNFALTGTASNYVESYALVVPVAAAASAVTSSSFTASWAAPAVGTVDNGYRLDVATNAAFTTGLTTTTVAGLSYTVTGLNPGTTYYYRVRADKTSVTSLGAYSSTSTVATCALPQALAQNVTVTLNAGGTASTTAAAVNNGSTANCGPAAAGSLSLSPTAFTCADAVPNAATNTALAFTGTQYAQGTHGLLPQGNAPRTIEAWVYPTVASQGGGIFNYGTGTPNLRSGLTINGTILYYVGESNDQAGVTTLTPNVWHHVAATYDGTTLKLYVDGVLDATKTVTTPFNTTGTTWRMSQRITSAGEFLNGRLDEVRVWTRPLTAAEITQSFTKNNPTSLAGLVARWDMHEGSGSSLGDVTGNSAAATITGTAAWPTPGIAYNGVMTVLTVTDTNGNTSRAAATVTVVDNTAPTAVAQNVTLVLNATGTATTTAAAVNNGSSDNCAVQTLELFGVEKVVNGTFDTNANGWTPANVDASGGYRSTGGNPGGMFILNDNGRVGIDPTLSQTVTGLTVGATYLLRGSYENFYSFVPVGAQAFAVDLDGNQLTTFPSPGAVWTPFSLRFTATATSHTLAFRGEIGTTDIDIAIDNISLTQLNPTFTCANVGANAVTLYVTDPSGNQASADAVVTVQDNTAPTAAGSGPLPAAPVLATSNVPEAGNYGILYQLDVPNVAGFNALAAVPYTVNNSGAAIANPARVAYFMELQSGGATKWVWASMDNFAPNLTQLGLPNPTANNKVWSQSVNNLNVFASGNAGVTTGTSLGTGRVEMWRWNYGQGNTDNVPGASSSTYDFGDQVTINNGSYGSFQVHNVTAGQTLLAYNNWGTPGSTGDLGIGNQVGGNGNPDWTFAANAAGYTVKRIYILVPNNSAFTQPATVALNAAGTATVTQSVVYTGATDNCGVTAVVITPSTFGCAQAGTTQLVTVAASDASGNTTTQSALVTVQDNIAPTFAACGAGTPASPFTNLNCAKGMATGTYTFSIGGNTFLGYVDGTTDGGGWVEILNYVHLGGTNPALNVRTTSLPVQTSAGLGANESATAAWGHADPSLVAAMNPQEVRFYGQTSAHSRVIHFKTSLAGVLSYLKTGTGTMNGIGSSFTALPGHTANLPAATTDYYTNQGNIAATEFPFWKSSTYHWGIRGLGNRWEVDDYPGNQSASTIHRMFVRGSATAVPGNAVAATNSPGQCGATVTLTGTQPATDNCTPTITFSPASGSFFALGATPVTATATDASGNSSTSTFVVTVTDAEAPVALAQSVSAVVDASGRAYVAPTAVNNGSTDNCAITNVALSASSFGACAASAALNLDGANDYVSLPIGVAGSATSFTFETWVNYVDNGYWTRVMDFGASTSTYMLLTPKANWDVASTDHPAFAISTAGNAGEQRISSSVVMPTGWHHLAVTLSKNATTGVVTGLLYLDGAVIGTNAAMTLTPADLGALTQNWLGRSQYAQDPYYKGQLDEVRIWNTARTAAEINLYKDKSLAGNTAGLLAYYDFNDAPNSTIIADRTAAARTGVLNNFAPATTFVAPGQVPALGLGANTVTLTLSDKFGNTSSTTATVTVTVPTPTVATWTGTLSTDWTDCRNWEYGTLPAATVDVVIPVVGTGLYPALAAGTGNARNLTLASATSLTVAGGATLQTYGNWANNGGTATLTGTVAFVGTGGATQTLGGTASTAFSTLVVNKPSGTVQLGRNLTINAGLTLTSGTLTTTGSYQVNMGGSAAISESETSYVIGKVVMNRVVTAGAAQAFSGLGLTLTPAAGSPSPGATLVTRVTGTALTGAGTSQSVQRYFDVQPAVNAGLNVTLAFAYFNHELNSIPVANLAMYKSATALTGPWQLQRYTTAGANVLTKTGVASLGIWTLGNSANPLPVELTAFTATPVDNAAVRLSWTTASEKNSARFEVERSLEGTSFEYVGTVAAAGTSTAPLTYALTDAKLPAGATLLYYRLRQVDQDGTVAYSPVRTVALGRKLSGLTLAPNPARATTLAGAQAGTSVEVFDALGRLVLTATADAAGTAALVLPAYLSTGVYVVRNGTQAVRLVVE